jgi:hypothetical protein
MFILRKWKNRTYKGEKASKIQNDELDSGSNPE